MILYDPASKKLIIVDYKPDLSFIDLGKHSFINSIPQVAAYALILEEMFGLDSSDINIECIIFNSDGAWSFDPHNVLSPINAFMLQENPGWHAPWEPLMQYSN